MRPPKTAILSCDDLEAVQASGICMDEKQQRIPDWADERLSNDLPVLRSRGEGQDLEYMDVFPENTRELAKEIAAFATSNTGTILLGVSDSGDLTGLPAASTASERDNLLQRIAGICRGAVKPSITPVAKFAVESGKTILVLTVPKGTQPIYYASNAPYLRHLTESRPADPHEVIDLVQTYIRSLGLTGDGEGTSERQALYSELAKLLINVIMFADEVDERMVNPWLDQWRSEYAYTASELRNMATSEIAIAEGIEDGLRTLAKKLDEITSMRLTMGSSNSLEELVKEAADHAREIKNRLIDAKPLSADSLSTIREFIKVSARRVKDLSERAEALANSGRIDELQSDASSLGRRVLEVSYYNIDSLGQGLQDGLRQIGHQLHLVETEMIYIDGGRSMREVLGTIAACGERLSRLAPEL